MFDFLRRPASKPLSDDIRHAIEKDGMTAPVSNPSLLRMVELGGRYSDRKVTYFRVFDPSAAAAQSLDARRYQDFDVFPGLILRSGHVERDGTVVLTRPVVVRAADSPIRMRAGRIVQPVDARPVVEGNGSPAATPASASAAEHSA